MRGDFHVDSNRNKGERELRLDLKLIGTSRITALYVSQMNRKARQRVMTAMAR
jgi:hypothetical protein